MKIELLHHWNDRDNKPHLPGDVVEMEDDPARSLINAGVAVEAGSRRKADAVEPPA